MDGLVDGFRRAGLAVFLCLAGAQLVWSQGNKISTCRPDPGHWLSGRLSVEVDALYWRPYRAGVLAGNLSEATSPSQSLTRSFFLEPGFAWGYRVDGRDEFCRQRNSVWASFMYLSERSTFQITVDQPDLSFSSRFVTFAGDVSLQIRERFKYYASDLWVGCKLLCGCCYDTSAFIGLRWLRLQRKLNSFAKQLPDGAATTTVRASQHFSGLGPAAGLEVTYQLWRGFGLYVIGISATAIGRNRNNNTVIETKEMASQPMAVSQKGTILTLLLEGRLGLLYRFCVHRFPLTLRLAYESRAHFDAFRAPSPSFALDPRRTIVLGGLTLGIAVMF